MLGVGMGIWAGHAYGAAAGVVADVTTTFGALTKAAAGGVAVTGTSISSGDASGHWQIASGRISPSSTGDTANLSGGPYSLVLDDGQEVAITIVADDYRVRTNAEMDAAFTDAAPAGGKTITCRAETITTSIGVRLAKTAGAFTAPMVFTGETGCILQGTTAFEATSNITIQDLDFFYTGSNGSQHVLNFLSACTSMIVQDNIIRGDAQDPLGDFSASGAYQNPATGIGTSSGAAAADFSGTIRRNQIRDVNMGMGLASIGTGGFSIIDNEISKTYSDCIQLSCSSSGLTSTKEISRNVAHTFMGDPSDADNPHIDFIQFVAGAATDGLDLTNVFIRQNVAWVDETVARGSDVDGPVCFNNGAYTLILKDAVVAGNVMLLDSSHNISIDNVDGGTFVNNTCCGPSEAYTDATGVAIALGVSSSTGNVDVRNNVSDAYRLLNGATYDTTGSVTLGTQASRIITYATQFDGTTFAPNTFAEVKTMFSVVSGVAGAIGSGYGVYGDVRDESGWSYDASYETNIATNADITSINADGWRAVSSDTTVFDTYDPNTDPEYLVVERDGFDASGSAITVTDNLILMKEVREPYSAHAATPISNEVAISDYVYSGEVITGVTNNSTRAYAKPICQWLDYDSRVVTGQSYTAKLSVAHWAARSGRPVAAVEFSATDGVTTVLSGKISAMTKADYTASGLSAPHFEATLALSTLDDDAFITIDAVIYPWVGDTAFTASTDFATYPSPNFCEMKIVNLVAEGPVYAYVDGVGGSDAVHETAATAATTPYSTIALAAAAIQTYNNANFTRNNATGGIIRLTATSFTAASFSSVAMGDGALIIEAADVADKATTIYLGPSAALSNGIPDKLAFKDITIKRAGDATDRILMDSDAGSGSSNMLALENCTFDANGDGWYEGLLYRTGRTWFIECDGLDTCFLDRSAVNKTIMAIGTDFASAGGTAAYAMTGCRNTQGQVYDTATNTNCDARSGGYFGFNFLGSNSSSNPCFRTGLLAETEGLALVGNIFEHMRVSNTGAAAFIHADAIGTELQNCLVQMNTVIGGDLSIGYTVSPYAGKTAQLKFNVVQKLGSTTDVGETSGSAIDNWPILWKVGSHTNAMILGGGDGESTFDVGHEQGEIAAIGSVSGSTGTPLVVDWTDDKSSDGDALGQGDYSPGGSTVLAVIPTGLALYPWDQNGVAITDDGTSYIGAAQ